MQPPDLVWEYWLAINGDAAWPRPPAIGGIVGAGGWYLAQKYTYLVNSRENETEEFLLFQSDVINHAQVPVLLIHRPE